MNKTDLIQKIKQLEGISQDERSYLINLVNTKKKYGLVWEDKPEDVEEQLRIQLPVLREVVEKRIKSESGFPGLHDNQNKEVPPIVTTLFPEFENQENQINIENKGSDSCPNHILIEGDNLHALTALSFTHEGKIDVIYIDPPYNTGNKDFKYNDSYVDKEDSYRHSKWLSFMHKRLQIAKRLLSDKGVIFISIDDNEQSQLKMLCDEVFGENNNIATNIWEKIHSTKNDAKYLSVNHEYVLFYSKQIDNISINLLPRTEDMDSRYKNLDNDTRGPWQSGDLAANEVRKEGNYEVISPITGKSFFVPSGKHWVYSQENMTILIAENRIWFGRDGNGFPRKKRFLTDVKEGKKASTIWTSQEVGHNQEGKRDLKEFFEQSESLFSTPKPIRLISRILALTTNRTSTILDFFAGSGTTLHATMQLNTEDGGNRQCIMVTNNENNICEEVTYERNRRVIKGYTNTKGEWVNGLTNNNLRYYKCEFVGREPSLKNKRELTQVATELLCIKEDCYEEKTLDIEIANKEDLKNIRFFEENNKRILVVYDDQAIETSVEIIKSIISKNTVPENGIKVYVFSPGQYPFTEEFEEVLPYITLCALPDAIYKAFLNVLPKKKRPSIPEIEDEAIENQPGLIE